MKNTPLFATVLLALAAPLPAHAATLNVTVIGDDGKPAADAVVMLRRTGGFQAFDVREVPLVVQKDIRFSPYVTVVPPRGMVRFVNEDRFDHHVRSMSSGPMSSVAPPQEFEFRLAGVRGNKKSSADLKIETSGAIVLGCHLHGSMRAHIFVTPTPWYAVTDANGRATLEAPDGPGTVAVWHPDQLSEQPAQPALQLAGAQALQQKLNFTPRKRPPPRTSAKGEYEN